MGVKRKLSSDHLPVMLELNTRSKKMETLINITNWSRYRDGTKIDNFRINNTQNTEKELEKQISEAITKSSETKA